MSNWQELGEEEGFFRIHPNANGRPWYQVIRISWPDDHGGRTWLVDSGELDVSGFSRDYLEGIFDTWGMMTDCETADEMSEEDIVYILAMAGEFETDYSMPNLASDYAYKIVKALNEWGIHDLDYITD